MRIDSNYLGGTACSSNEQQRVRSTRHEAEPQTDLNTGQTQQGGATSRVSATAAPPRTARGADRADISGVSISDLARAVHTAPEVRHTKVQSLRAAVDSGTYQLSPERIAESMLAQATNKLR